MAYGAPKAHWHMCTALGKVDQAMGNVVGVVIQRGDCLGVHTILQRHA